MLLVLGTIFVVSADVHFVATAGKDITAIVIDVVMTLAAAIAVVAILVRGKQPRPCEITPTRSACATPRLRSDFKRR